MLGIGGELSGHHFFVEKPNKMEDVVVEEVFDLNSFGPESGKLADSRELEGSSKLADSRELEGSSEETDKEGACDSDENVGDTELDSKGKVHEEETKKTALFVPCALDTELEEQEGEENLQLSTFCQAPPYLLATPPNTLIRCKVVDVYDGDSCSVNSFFPGPALQQLRVRLRGITSLEIRSRSKLERQAAQICRNALVAFITGKCVASRKMRRPEIQGILGASSQKDVFFECNGVDKYGRVLADLYRTTLGTAPFSATRWLQKQGLVTPYVTGKKRTLPDILLKQIVAQGAAGIYDAALPSLSSRVPEHCGEENGLTKRVKRGRGRRRKGVKRQDKTAKTKNTK